MYPANNFTKFLGLLNFFDEFLYRLPTLSKRTRKRKTQNAKPKTENRCLKKKKKTACSSCGLESIRATEIGKRGDGGESEVGGGPPEKEGGRGGGGASPRGAAGIAGAQFRTGRPAAEAEAATETAAEEPSAAAEIAEGSGRGGGGGGGGGCRGGN